MKGKLLIAWLVRLCQQVLLALCKSYTYAHPSMMCREGSSVPKAHPVGCSASCCCISLFGTPARMPARRGGGTGNTPGWQTPPRCSEACSGPSGLSPGCLRDPRRCLAAGLEVPVLAVGRSVLRPATAYAFPVAARVLAVRLSGRGTSADMRHASCIACPCFAVMVSNKTCSAQQVLPAMPS